MNKAILAAFPIFFLLVGCTKSETTSSTSTSHYANFSCTTSSHCADNSADGKVAYAALFNATNCAGFMGTFIGYVKGTVSCSGGSCTGGSTEGFLDGSDAATATPAAGTYSIYRFIDTNGDTNPTSGEPFDCTDGNSWDGTSIDVTLGSNNP